MNPSKIVSDQYQAEVLNLKDGDSVTGMVIGESWRKVTLITATGDRIDVRKNRIRSRRASDISLMPDGLIDTMHRHDILDLITYLERGSGL